MGIAQVFLCIAASCVGAEPAADETPAAKIDFYLSAMLAERQKLCSGDMIVFGKKSGRFPGRPAADYSGKVFIFCAFDQNRIRIDNLEPGFVSSSGTPGQEKTSPGRMQRKYIQTPQKNITWIQNQWTNQISIRVRYAPMLGQFFFFDPRGLGLSTWREVTENGSKIEESVAALKGPAWEKSVDASDPQCLQLVFLKQLGTWSREQRYWLRPEQGFAPFRHEARTRNLNSGDDHWQVNEHAEIAWEEIDGIWLPVKLDMTRNGQDVEETIDWKIRWRSVNRPIDERLFDPLDFGAPPGVETIDHTPRAFPGVAR